MMLGDKVFYKTLFKNLFSETFELQLWDGSSEIYGDGIPKFKIIFNEPIPKSLYGNKESFLGSTSKFSHLIKVVKNNLKNSKENIEFHYDIGNDFYKLWLDDTMTYSCGYFKSQEDSLTEAQKNKVNHILKKLNLQEGETLLDIGCGWGELIITAAKMYKVKATGITLSTQQFEKVKERIESEGLNALVDVKLIDYRELKDIKFDKIVSVGMIIFNRHFQK